MCVWAYCNVTLWSSYVSFASFNDRRNNICIILKNKKNYSYTSRFTSDHLIFFSLISLCTVKDILIVFKLITITDCLWIHLNIWDISHYAILQIQFANRKKNATDSQTVFRALNWDVVVPLPNCHADFLTFFALCNLNAMSLKQAAK
jgi:hypothetical protein